MRTVEMNQSISLPQDRSRPILLQAPCSVHVNTMALHTSQSSWGPGVLDFDPTRWLRGEDELMYPPKGTYIPWSTGPRVCPGQKMSQVEFVAVIMTLFGRCTVEPVLDCGQNMQQARQRLLDLMEDSQPLLTLQMNRPQDLRLRWQKRHASSTS